ncbi:Aldo/keto reductase [Auriculariales sp. MPI-PUGE-AT-0066]|nr:Aldo/keto reductase [Auriculariales sp. MPI-PUGE-AT-0066]
MQSSICRSARDACPLILIPQFPQFRPSMSYGTVKLNDGTEVPALAFGAGSVWKFHDVAPYVLQALHAGFRHLDNAQYYQTEQYVGQAIAQSNISREDIFITSKYSGVGVSVEDAFAQSLSQLGVKALNLYLIHFPGSAGGDISGVWKKFEDLRASGGTKSIGVSNFGVADLKTLLSNAEVTPAVNQIQLNPYNYAKQLPIIELCGEKGIAIEAYSSLAPITQFPGGPADPVLERAAKRIGGTPSQVIFQWLRQKGIVIVTTSGKLEHLQEYLEVPLLPALEDDEIADLEEAGREGGDAWAAIEAAREASTTSQRPSPSPEPRELNPRDSKKFFVQATADLEAGPPAEPSSSRTGRTRLLCIVALALSLLTYNVLICRR